MSAEKKADNLVNISIGILMIVFNCFWLFHNLECIRELYHFMIPDRMPALNIICAFAGIFLAIRLIRGKISAWTALPANIGLYCICLLVETLITS